MTIPATTSQLDTAELERRVKTMYEEVALEPERVPFRDRAPTGGVARLFIREA